MVGTYYIPIQNLKNKLINNEQALNLPLSEVQELIQKDPVTCARYFDYKLARYFDDKNDYINSKRR